MVVVPSVEGSFDQGRVNLNKNMEWYSLFSRSSKPAWKKTF